MKKEEILSTIISSTILDDYASYDQELNELLISTRQFPDDWRNSGKVFIGDGLAPTVETERIFSNRLKALHLAKKTDSYDKNSELELCIQKIIRYCASNPDGYTKVVLFNCSEHSYNVYIGISNQCVEVICNIKGNHISKNFLE